MFSRLFIKLIYFNFCRFSSREMFSGIPFFKVMFKFFFQWSFKFLPENLCNILKLLNFFKTKHFLSGVTHMTRTADQSHSR